MVLSGHAYDHHSTLNDHWPSFCLLVNLMTIWLQFCLSTNLMIIWQCEQLMKTLAILLSVGEFDDQHLALLLSIGKLNEDLARPSILCLSLEQLMTNDDHLATLMSISTQTLNVHWPSFCLLVNI